MDYEYYYNDVPGKGLCRNNLIYTSLISHDKKTFVQWYFNDGVYHKGQNQVVDPEKMDEKWQREVKFLSLMQKNYPDLVPEILDIDYKERKIYLRIDGSDFWQRSLDRKCNFDGVLADWQEQMIVIINAHSSLGLRKYSMHPSSYFLINGRLKSINYFFTYYKNEKNISIKEVESHIHTTRQDEIRKNLKTLGIEWDKPQPWKTMNRLCWESFRNNYPNDFIDKVLNLDNV